MTLDWRQKPTTREVYAVMRASHPELVPFSSFSDPTGTARGGLGTHGRMDTEWAFPEADIPILGASTTWEIDPETPHRRIGESSRFWLCVAIEEK